MFADDDPMIAPDGNKRMAFVGMFITALFSIGLYWLRPVEGVIAFLGLGIIWISLVPWTVYLLGPRTSAVPFLPAIGTFYAVFFGLPIFTVALAWPDSNSIVLYSRMPVGELRADAVMLAGMGIGGMIAAFYVGHRALKRIPAFALPRVVATINHAPLYWVLLVAHQLERIFPSWSGIPSGLQFFEPAGYVAFGGFYILWRRGEFSRLHAILIFGAFLPLEIYLRLRLLYLTDILLMLIFAGLLLWRERQFRIVGAVAVAVLLILSVYGASSAVRYTKSEGFERLALAAKAYLTQFVAGTYSLDTRSGEVGQGQTYAFWGRFGSLVMRTSHIWVFHVVATSSPDSVPYWNGATYRPLLTSPIPRALYPAKPEERFGLEFGRRYGFLEAAQDGTSVNIPWLTELLANFGPPGVMLGMPLFGFLLAFLDRTFNAKKMSDPAFLIGLTLIFPLTYPESNLSVMTGSMIVLLASLTAFFVVGSLLIRQLSALRR
jgi:hypothetical protein